MTLAWLNGQYLPLSDAKLSILDRGLLFADGVYEVIPVYKGHLFRLPQHLKRLRDNLAHIKLDISLSDTKWAEILTQLVERSGGGNQSVYLQCTRGAAFARDFIFPKDAKPTVFAFCMPLKAPDIATLRQGISVIACEDIRWQYCHIKSIALLPAVLMRQAAEEAGAKEAILIRNGLVTEASSSNVFVVQSDALITPPKSQYALGGITRDLVLELAEENGVAYAERDIPIEMLTEVDEIWVTSSTKEITPVVKLNGQPVGTGQAGPLWERMIQLYAEFKERL
jgi:D-alanine transaminase